MNRTLVIGLKKELGPINRKEKRSSESAFLRQFIHHNFEEDGKFSISDYTKDGEIDATSEKPGNKRIHAFKQEGRKRE